MSKQIIKCIGSDGRYLGEFTINCLQCGKEFQVKHFQLSGKHQRKFCSIKCSAQRMIPIFKISRLGSGNPVFGKRAWNYKDGMARHRTAKNKYDYWIWRRKVIQRDNQICQNCGIKLRRRDCIVHHIRPWHLFKDLRYEISNGIVYCRSCHNKIDPIIRKYHFK